MLELHLPGAFASMFSLYSASQNGASVSQDIEAKVFGLRVKNFENSSAFVNVTCFLTHSG